MVPVGSSFLSVFRPTSRVAPDLEVQPDTEPEPDPQPGTSIVWLRGEHDVSTLAALSDTLSRAVALGDTALVVDLSGVQFMSAATVGVLVRTRELLRLRSRSLTLRAPSTYARRVFEICGLADLLDPPGPQPARNQGAKSSAAALSSWVAVRPEPRFDRQGDPLVPTVSLAFDPLDGCSKPPVKSLASLEEP